MGVELRSFSYVSPPLPKNWLLPLGFKPTLKRILDASTGHLTVRIMWDNCVLGELFVFNGNYLAYYPISHIS